MYKLKKKRKIPKAHLNWKIENRQKKTKTKSKRHITVYNTCTQHRKLNMIKTEKQYLQVHVKQLCCIQLNVFTTLIIRRTNTYVFITKYYFRSFNLYKWNYTRAYVTEYNIHRIPVRLWENTSILSDQPHRSLLLKIVHSFCEDWSWYAHSICKNVDLCQSSTKTV